MGVVHAFGQCSGICTWCVVMCLWSLLLNWKLLGHLRQGNGNNLPSDTSGDGEDSTWSSEVSVLPSGGLIVSTTTSRKSGSCSALRSSQVPSSSKKLSRTSPTCNQLVSSMSVWSKKFISGNFLLSSQLTYLFTKEIRWTFCFAYTLGILAFLQ